MIKENMEDNYNNLKERVFNSLSKTDLDEIRNILSSINEPTLVSGVGGSGVVSNYLAKVLSIKNDIVCEPITPRDVLYRNLKGFKNIIACSYKGNNYGVRTSFNNNLNKYLFSKNKLDGVTNINYNVEDEENSFISLAATIIPMTIALLYYCNDLSIVEDILQTVPQYSIRINNLNELFIGYESTPNDLIKPQEINFFLEDVYKIIPFFPVTLGDSKVYEILGGYETSSATHFLESTMTEAGLFIPVVHDKYDYCHGRSNLNFEYSNNLIFFDNETQLDKYYQEILPEQYKNIISIKKKFDDNIINDYYLTYISMMLCKELAKSLDKDLSLIKYSPLVKKLYRYEGEM